MFSLTRRPVTAVARIVIVSALVFAMLLPSGTYRAHGGSGGCWDPNDKEQAFKLTIDNARSEAGRVPLRLDPELSRVARRHARVMAERGALFHTPAERLGKLVTGWQRLGENVGFGANVADLHAAFMASQSHRANVLGRSYRHVGIGVERGPDGLWVTLLFESRSDPGTILPMPDCKGGGRD